MVLLILGLILFFSVHVLSVLPQTRGTLVNKFGLGPYKGLYSLAAIAGFVMIIMGKGQAPFVSIWEPPLFLRHVTMLLMLPAIILLIAAYIPSNIKRRIRHPMLMAVKLWATAHLLINGDLASMLLFLTFLAFGVVLMIGINRRGPKPEHLKSENLTPGNPSKPMYMDVLVVVIGLVVYGAVAMHHQYLAGVPLF